MDEDHSSIDPLADATTLVLDDVVAADVRQLALLPTTESAALTYAAGERWEGAPDQHDENSLQELLDLIGDVDVDDDDDGGASADTPPSGAIGGKRALSTPDAWSSPATDPPETMRKKKKKRRYHEVLHMRESVDKLTQELDMLKQRQERAEGLLQDEGGDNNNGLVRWQQQAKKERQAVAHSRLQNAKLKETVAAHVEFAKSLQEALCKRQRPIDELHQCTTSHLQSNHVFAVRRPSGAKDSAIYGQLMEGVYDRAATLDEVFRANGLADVRSEPMTNDSTVSESRILLNENQALCIDLVNRYIVPFDFQASADVLWTHVLSKHLKLSDQRTQTEIILATDDILVTKQSANSNFLTQDRELTIEYSVSKRVCNTNCVSFLWESITESKGSLAASPQGTPAIQLAQHGWGRVTHVATASGSSAAVLHSYIRLTPSTIGAESNNQEGASQQLRFCEQFDFETFTARIIAAFHVHVASVRHVIESALIDEMIQACKPPLQKC